MEPLKKLLRVTPKPFLFIEITLLSALLVVSQNLDMTQLSFLSIKTVLHISLLTLFSCFLTSHFQIRHTPYLLIQDSSPYELIRTNLGINLFRLLIVYISFKEIAYLNSFILLVRNMCFMAHFISFTSFSFSLNSNIQFHSTKNGKLNLNYIIQSSLILASFIIIIASSYSPTLLFLNGFGICFVSILAYIGFKIVQSLRKIPLFNIRPKLSYGLTFVGVYFFFIIVSSLRLQSARNPLEVSLWQSFHFVNVSKYFDLTPSMDFVVQTEIPCSVFFPDILIRTCKTAIKKKFLTTEFPNTNHPEFNSLVRNDEQILSKFAYFYLKSLQKPTSLSNLWIVWISHSADLEKLMTLIKSSDTIASTVTTSLVKSTPNRPEIAKYISAEIVSRFADGEQIQKTLSYFFNNQKPFTTRLEIWEAWNKISTQRLQPFRLPASPSGGGTP